MTWAGRLAALGVLVSTLLAINDIPQGPISLAVIGAAVAMAWWLIPGFWRRVRLGAAGGALAGLVILGPGFRVAMRVVAMMEPTRTPEFSVGGTVFIIIGIGALMGGVLGIVGYLVKEVAHISSPLLSGLVLGLLVMGMLLADSGLREEFTDLGAGIALNVGMFATVSILYGIAVMKIAGRLAAKTEPRPDTSRIEVRA